MTPSIKIGKPKSLFIGPLNTEIYLLVDWSSHKHVGLDHDNNTFFKDECTQIPI